MAKGTGPRTVECYHCGHRFEVSARAHSSSCPHCNRGLMVEDVVIQKLHPITALQTCGRLLVKRRGRVIAKSVKANMGIEVEGVLTANAVSFGTVLIGAKAQWDGDCKAPSVVVKQGARISGHFTVSGKRRETSRPKEAAKPPQKGE